MHAHVHLVHLHIVACTLTFHSMKTLNVHANYYPRNTCTSMYVCKDLELIRFLFVLEAKVLIVAHLHQHVCSERGPTQCNNNCSVVGATQKQAGFISSSSCRPHHQIRERLRAVHSSLDPLLLGINSESVGGMSKVKEIQVAIVMRIASKTQVLLLYAVICRS